MALSSGAKPTVYSSTLTGLSKTIYDTQLFNGIIQQEAQIQTTIGSTTFTEDLTINRARVLKAKLNAWVIADSVIHDMTTDAEIKTNTLTTVETYVSGTGTNTGNLVAAPYPVSGSIKLGALQTLGKIF